ncbi:MAG: porin [Pseudomonadota bacterium]
MFKKALLMSSALAVVSIASPAFASDKDARIEALEAQMQVMFEEIQRLKAERTVEKQEQVALKQEIKTLRETTENNNAQIAAIEPAAGQSSGDFSEFRKGDFSLKPFGRIQLDAASFNDDERDHPNGAEFRRLRLGAKGDLPGDFGYKIQIGYDGDRTDIEDAFITYDGIDNTQLKLGNHKPAFGLVEHSSSNDNTFIERGSANDVFFEGRAIGLSATTYSDRWRLNAGVFNDDPGTSSADDEAFSVGSRVTGVPVKTDNGYLHIGGFVDYRSPDQEGESFEFDADAENSLQDADSVSVTINNADSAIVAGLEAAAIWGPLSLQGEYFRAKVDTDSGPEPTFDSAYIEGSWIITGESRPYKTSSATIGRPKPDNPFNTSNGDWGAFEVGARYSTVDLNDAGFTGGEMDTVTLGANWYLNNYLRFSGNYIFADTDENAVTPNDEPEIMLVRAQAAF